jgi:hypothetical protein
VLGQGLDLESVDADDAEALVGEVLREGVAHSAEIECHRWFLAILFNFTRQHPIRVFGLLNFRTLSV